jgi:hypothetical protein
MGEVSTVIHSDKEGSWSQLTGLSALAVCAGFLFSVRAVFVLISARWFNIGTVPGVLTGFALDASLLILATLAAFGVHAHSSRQILHDRAFRWVTCYVIFAGCSFFWSAAVSPASSALYWGQTVVDVASVVLLARSQGATCTVLSLVKGYVIGSLLIASMAWIMPAANDLRLGDPDYFNTNQIANLCAFAVLMCGLLVYQGERLWTIPAIFLGLTLVRSFSKATVIAFVVAEAYRLVSDRAISLKRKWLSVAGAVVVTLCFWGLLNSYVEEYTSSGNQAETLTGRTGIWLWALDAGLSRPIFGNGYDAMWKVAPPFGGELFEARHAENELLEQFFAYGVCGIVLMIGVYVSLYRRFRFAACGSEKSLLISFLVYVAVRGLAEAETFDLLLPLWMITALLLLIAPDPVAQKYSTLQPEPLNGNSAVAPI